MDRERQHDAPPGPPAWPDLQPDAPEPALTRPARAAGPSRSGNTPSRGVLAVGVVLLGLAGVGVWSTVLRQTAPEESVSSRVEVAEARPGATASASLLRDLGEQQYEAGEHAAAYRTFQRLLAVAPADEEAARYIRRLEARMVVVQTDPPGAAVFSGDEHLGRAPVGLFPSGGATLRLRLEAEGRPVRVVDVAPDARGELRFDLPAR